MTTIPISQPGYTPDAIISKLTELDHREDRERREAERKRASKMSMLVLGLVGAWSTFFGATAGGCLAYMNKPQANTQKPPAIVMPTRASASATVSKNAAITAAQDVRNYARSTTQEAHPNLEAKVNNSLGPMLVRSSDERKAKPIYSTQTASCTIREGGYCAFTLPKVRDGVRLEVTTLGQRNQQLERIFNTPSPVIHYDDLGGKGIDTRVEIASYEGNQRLQGYKLNVKVMPEAAVVRASPAKPAINSVPADINVISVEATKASAYTSPASTRWSTQPKASQPNVIVLPAPAMPAAIMPATATPTAITPVAPQTIGTTADEIRIQSYAMPGQSIYSRRVPPAWKRLQYTSAFANHQIMTFSLYC